jgi:hypothetical protein
LETLNENGDKTFACDCREAKHNNKVRPLYTHASLLATTLLELFLYVDFYTCVYARIACMIIHLQNKVFSSPPLNFQTYAGQYCEAEATVTCSGGSIVASGGKLNSGLHPNGHLFCTNDGTCKAQAYLGCECPKGYQ